MSEGGRLGVRLESSTACCRRVPAASLRECLLFTPLAGVRAGDTPGLSEHSLSGSLALQLEQFNMIENAISSNSLYSPCSTLNYSQAAMMGLTSSHGSLQDAQQLSYASHGNIPNIILTGGPGLREQGGRGLRSASPLPSRGALPPIPFHLDQEKPKMFAPCHTQRIRVHGLTCRWK